MLFSILYNIPKFFELRVIQNENSTTGLEKENMTVVILFKLTKKISSILDILQDFQIKPTGLRLNHLYINVYLIYLNLIVNGKFHKVIFSS